MYDVLCLFFCIEHDACDNHACTYYIVERNLFAKKHPGQQHDKNEAGAFKHISGTEFYVF